MITARLLVENYLETGDETLITKWRGTPDSCLWIDIEAEISPAHHALLQGLGCDPAAIDTASRERHPPKVEEFEQTTLLLIRDFDSLDEELTLTSQQLALFIGERLLITIHRQHSAIVCSFLDRLKEAPERLAHPDALALEIMHTAKGRYLGAILAFEDRLEAFEDALLVGSAENAMKELVAYRSRLRILRRVFNYDKSLAAEIIEGGSRHLGSGTDDENGNYRQQRALYERCERVYSLCAMYYEICGDLVEGHISLSSHRLNSTMKILTIITAVFVPLSFLAGLYGMNFAYMPELANPYGYFIVLGVMASIAAGMLILFRRIRWL